MADIKYVIGARDEATAPMQKVESSLDKLSKSTKKLDETAAKSNRTKSPVRLAVRVRASPPPNICSAAD